VQLAEVDARRTLVPREKALQGTDDIPVGLRKVEPIGIRSLACLLGAPPGWCVKKPDLARRATNYLVDVSGGMHALGLLTRVGPNGGLRHTLGSLTLEKVAGTTDQ